MKTPGNSKALLLSFILLFCTAAVSAAVPWIAFLHFNSSYGLSHNTVPAIAQDSVGYIWIATHDGLNRYDGLNSKVYRHSQTDSLSLPSNKLLGVLTDNNGKLWVVSHKSVSQYLRERDAFRNFYLPEGVEAVAICPLPSGEMLVGTNNGIYSLDPSNGKIVKTDFKTDFGGARITDLSTDSRNLYIATSDGLWTSPIGSRRAVRVAEIPAVSVNSVFFTPKGEILVGTEGRGIFRKSAPDSRFEVFDRFGDNRIHSQFTRDFNYDRDGRLWIATVKGLFVCDPADGSVLHVTAMSDKEDRDASERLEQGSLRCVFADSQGGMWLGSDYGGIEYYHPLHNQFRGMRRNNGLNRLNDNAISCMKGTPNGEILIGTNNGGVNIYNPRTNSYRHLTKADGLASNDVKAVRSEPTSNRIFIGMNHGGLAISDINTLKISKTLLPGMDVYDMRTAIDGHSLWVCTPEALYYIDPSTGAERIVKTDTNGKAIPSDRITDLYRDSKQRLWISGKKGVTVYEEKPGGTLLTLPLLDKYPEIANAHVNAVGESRSTGKMIVSTRTGLYLISPDFKQVKHLTMADGLPNDIVYGALEDNNENIWISTNSGLSEYDPATGKTRNFSQSDYLPFNQFNPKSYYRTKDGRMYFGGTRGIIAFDPDKITPNPYSPTPIISGIQLFDKQVNPGDETEILTENIESTDLVELRPDQSMVSFDFTICNFANGKKSRFAYRMEGYDEDWIETTGHRSADYRNLPPGTYNFQVKAANSDGLWSDVTSLKVKVLPRWHQLWWVRLLFILIAAGAVAATVRYFTRRKLERERLEFERRDIERRQEVNDMKVNFFVNMSHELRTPLTLILLPVTELLEQKRNDPKVTDKLDTIRANTLRILRTVNQILDYQRAENGMFSLKVSPQDINHLARQEFDIYRQAAKHHEIDYRLDSTADDSPVYLDPSYISIIIGNLLSNSFKHTPDGRSITLSLANDGQKVVIKVSDTGEGIAADKLPHIFDRFYKATETGFGSGIGLSLVKRLVELHHGTISVDSAVGRGTTFTVSLPAAASAYSANETVEKQAEDSLIQRPLPYTPFEPEIEEESEAEADSETGEKQGRPTMLLVDDNSDIIKYMTEALAPTYRVLTAANGEEALKTLESEESVDMVITDVMMPIMDGVQLCKAIKRNLRTSHIPVVMLSAKSDVRDQLEAMKVGADDYLPKPFSMPLLLGKIANRLRTRARAISYYSSSTEIEPAKMALNPLDEEFLNNALKVVEKHLDNSEFTTEEFAREMLVSRTNLHMKLKALTGESANEFIRRQRMNRALELLKSGRYTVAEVSAMAGYSTPSYFSTSFKKFFGGLPSEFTKQ